MSNSSEKNKDFNFCPLCQAPLLFLKISPFAHVAGCSVIWDILPACPDGKNCVSSSIFHYRDFAHSELAAYRSSNEYVNPSFDNFSGNSAKKSPFKSVKKNNSSVLKRKKKKKELCLTKESNNELIENESSSQEKLELKNKVDDSFCDDDSVFKEDPNNKKKSSKRPAVSCCDKNLKIIAKKLKNLNSINNSISSDVVKTETKDLSFKDVDIDLLNCAVNVNRDCDISSSSVDIFNDSIKCNNKKDEICFSQYFNKSVNSDDEKIEFDNGPCFTSSPKQSSSISTLSSPSVSYSPLESDKSSLSCSKSISITFDSPEASGIIKRNENQKLSPVKTFNTFKFVPKTERKLSLNVSTGSGESSKISNSLLSTRNDSSCVANCMKNEKIDSLCHESADIHCTDTNESKLYKNKRNNDFKFSNVKDGLSTVRSSSNDKTNSTSVSRKSSCFKNFQLGNNEKKAETAEDLSSNTAGIAATKIFEKKDNIKISDNVEFNEVARPSIKSFGQKSRVKKVCPFFKRIPDTSMVVDAFEYGYIPGISTYFLSHFHSDHYVGLTKSFSMPIFCSEITANLVKMRIGVNETWLNVINVGERRVVNGTEVVALDANHCPGSLMFLFQLRTGQNYLHVGDFRFCTGMETYPELQRLHINKLFLDTTYCKPDYDFPAQDDIVNEVVNIAKQEVTKNPQLLIVCGSYVIGKEKVFRAIAKECNFNIWADSNKKRVFKCLNYPDILSRLKNKSSEAQVHVLPMNNLTFDKLYQHLNKHNNYKNIVAFRPTGWASKYSSSSGSIRKRVQDRIIIYDVPYSEHSSFSELRRFVQYMKPDEIIPTVNMGRPAERDEMQRHFTSWLSEVKQPRQTNLLNFLKLSKKTSADVQF